MSRKINLTRIHAINWYGYNDTLPVEGNLLLAGVTGSGKSVLMDLIQLVLVGSERALFNRSATGTTSARDLKGYCLGDTKQEENGVPHFLRPKGAITYVALEFTWPDQPRCETWGLRIEFRNAAESHARITPFFCDGSLTRDSFLSGERRPLELTVFEGLIEKEHNGRVFKTQDQYLRDMAVHLNFKRAVLASLLPMAMSFTNLKNFDEFCRRFILPDEPLDVENVVASYKTFQAYERDLRELDDQRQQLAKIRELFHQYQIACRDKVVARFLHAELNRDYVARLHCDHQLRLKTLKVELAEEELRIGELDELIKRRKIDIDQIKALINQSPEGQLYTFLKAQNQTLESEVEKLRGIGSNLEDALRFRIQNARSWLNQLEASNLPEPISTAALEAAIKRLDDCTPERSELALRELTEVAEKTQIEISKNIRPSRERAEELRRESERLKEEIRALELGNLPFPARLLDALNEVLPRAGRMPAAQPLCKLCEVTDERWRPAIEVAFTRKFAIVVADEHYDQALKVYHELRIDSPQESLVNPVKALKLARPILPGSLAEKLHADHPVAKAIIIHLFGKLMCVERPEQMAAHDLAVLPDGFMSRGAFVERRRHYDNHPFVGQRGLEKQLTMKQSRANDLRAEERRLKPMVEAADKLTESARQKFPEHTSLTVDVIRAQELPNRQMELAENIAKLNSIDRSTFEEREKECQRLEKELQTWETELRTRLGSQKRGETQRLEQNLKEATARLEEADIHFERVKSDTDVSIHLARLNEWRLQVLQDLAALDAAAREFEKQYHQAREKEIETWKDLVSERRMLAIARPKFDELNPEETANKSYETLLTQIEGSDIPGYKTKAEAEHRRWEGLFRTQVLQKLHYALKGIGNTIFLLNGYLKLPIGNDRYQIVKKLNPDFKLYHQLLDLNVLHQEDGLFYATVDEEMREALTHFLDTLVNRSDSIEAVRLLDYRHYFDYDLLVSDIRIPDASPVSVDKQSGKFSGGENQSPYFVAILASYLRAYRRHETRWRDPSLALVPIDEAFSKLSGERIEDCINALKALDLQGVFSMSSGNIPYAFELCDQLVVVSKHEERVGGRTVLRNVAVSMSRDSAESREIIQAHG
jgi:Putative exonuclease SbcCD, C subunit/P-loop containing region of AAA domain